MSKFSLRLDDHTEEILNGINIRNSNSKNEKIKHLIRNYQEWQEQIETLQEKLTTANSELSEIKTVLINKQNADQQYQRIVSQMVS